MNGFTPLACWPRPRYGWHPCFHGISMPRLATGQVLPAFADLETADAALVDEEHCAPEIQEAVRETVRAAVAEIGEATLATSAEELTGHCLQTELSAEEEARYAEYSAPSEPVAATDPSPQAAQAVTPEPSEAAMAIETPNPAQVRAVRGVSRGRHRRPAGRRAIHPAGCTGTRIPRGGDHRFPQQPSQPLTAEPLAVVAPVAPVDTADLTVQPEPAPANVIPLASPDRRRGITGVRRGLAAAALAIPVAAGVGLATAHYAAGPAGGETGQRVTPVGAVTPLTMTPLALSSAPLPTTGVGATKPIGQTLLPGRAAAGATAAKLPNKKDLARAKQARIAAARAAVAKARTRATARRGPVAGLPGGLPWLAPVRLGAACPKAGARGATAASAPVVCAPVSPKASRLKWKPAK